MAISLKDIYTYIVGATSAYPWGSFKNATGSGTLDGTPFEKQWANDVYGFLQRLLAVSGTTPSGVPDTAETSQYFDAMLNIVSPIGRPQFCLYTTPDPGWLELDGKTIGNATSNATARANADTQALFIKLWGNSTTVLYTSAGVVTAKGANAAADFAANKQLKLVDTRGRYPKGWDHGAGVDPAPVAVGGTQEDAQQNITGSFTVDDMMMAGVAGAFYDAGAVNYDADSRGGGGHLLGFDASRQVRTAAEVRVKGFIGMWVVRYN